MAVDHSLTYVGRSLRNAPHRARLRAIERRIGEMAIPPGLEYLDFGCSNGFLTALVKSWIGAARAIGLDRSDEQIRVGTLRHPDIKFVQFDLCKANSPPPRGDFVTCFETLEHVGHLPTALQNLMAALRPGGQALFSVPIEVGPIGLAKFAAKMIYGYRLDGLPPRRMLVFQYLAALLTGRRISQFRGPQQGYGTHFGFDYRDIDDWLRVNQVRYEAYSSGTTRFYCVWFSEPARVAPRSMA